SYGIAFPVPAYFYPVACTLALLFILFATELGALLALLVALLLPRRKRLALIAVGVICAIGVGLWVFPLWWHRPTNMLSEAGIKAVMNRMAFCQHWALPSRWVSHGMLSAGRGDLRTSLFLGMVLLSNVLFLGVVSHRAGHYAYRRTWSIVQGASTKRRYRGDGVALRALGGMLVFLPRRLRLLVAKDLRTFLRDPSQWSQFLLFFGLLALYIINLPRFGVEDLPPHWRSLVSNLNLGATCLTLATLTSRFVFPQLSLEGRRIWVTGLLPMRRALIIWGKFFFAAVGTFVVSGGLIALSDVLIGLPPWTLAVHLVTVGCVCCGLNGLAVGLGALYPRPGTDNPSKIVSSFGGTLNLICSICFLALALAPVVSVLHLHTLGALEGPEFGFWMATGLGTVVVLSAVACITPMVAGARAFARMEF
ncbi:MAG: putative ABC transporter permease subunit, partial [Planctomycetota bacterium]